VVSQTEFQAVIRQHNYVKNIQLIGRIFKELRDDMEAEYTAALEYSETHWLYHVKVIHKLFEFREATVIILSDNKNNEDVNLCYNEVLFRNWSVWYTFPKQIKQCEYINAGSSH
jgi:hypothetical protein